MALIDESWVKYKKAIIERIGNGFMLGIAAGSIMYFTHGLILAPRGQRIATAAMHLRDRAPLLGGSIALWSGTFAATGGYLKYKRGGIDDEWNDTIGGGFTAFIVNIRSGGFYMAASQGVQLAAFFYLMERMIYKNRGRDGGSAELNDTFKTNDGLGR